jgi:hypothetical protein
LRLLPTLRCPIDLSQGGFRKAVWSALLFGVALLWRCVPYTDSIHSGRNSVSVTVSALFIFRHAQGSRANMRSKLRAPSMNAGLRWAISGSKRSHFLGKAKVRIFIPIPPHLYFFTAEEHIQSTMFVT